MIITPVEVAAESDVMDQRLAVTGSSDAGVGTGVADGIGLWDVRSGSTASVADTVVTADVGMEAYVGSIVRVGILCLWICMLLRQWYESLLQSMSWPNQGEKTDDRADKRRAIRPQQGMQIFVKVMTGWTITLTVTRDIRIEASQSAAGTHDRVEMAAEREVEREVERETRQPAASTEL